MLELIDEILRRTESGETVALCVVADARGSTPQRRGAAMLVLANGQTLGTLGGGCVEAEMRVRALKLIDQPTDRVYAFKLDHDFGWDDGLLCGGLMEIAVRVIASPDAAVPLIALRNELHARRIGTFRFDATDEAGATRSIEMSHEPSPALIIAGAGHVGCELARLAVSIGFDVTVIDDREDFLTPARFPGSTRVIGDIERELRAMPIDPQTYVVIVTRGHRHDGSALAAIIDSHAKYIGLIGSKRKIRTIFDELLKAGVAREKLMRVQAPIGLELGAVTPAEIAVSIAAQLIAVKRGVEDRSVRSMKMNETDLIRYLDRDQLRAADAEPTSLGDLPPA